MKILTGMNLFRRAGGLATLVLGSYLLWMSVFTDWAKLLEKPMTPAWIMFVIWVVATVAAQVVMILNLKLRANWLSLLALLGYLVLDGISNPHLITTFKFPATVTPVILLWGGLVLLDWLTTSRS